MVSHGVDGGATLNQAGGIGQGSFQVALEAGFHFSTKI